MFSKKKKGKKMKQKRLIIAGLILLHSGPMMGANFASRIYKKIKKFFTEKSNRRQASITTQKSTTNVTRQSTIRRNTNNANKEIFHTFNENKINDYTLKELQDSLKHLEQKKIDSAEHLRHLFNKDIRAINQRINALKTSGNTPHHTPPARPEPPTMTGRNQTSSSENTTHRIAPPRPAKRAVAENQTSSLENASRPTPPARPAHQPARTVRNQNPSVDPNYDPIKASQNAWATTPNKFN